MSVLRLRGDISRYIHLYCLPTMWISDRQYQGIRELHHKYCRSIHMGMTSDPNCRLLLSYMWYTHTLCFHINWVHGYRCKLRGETMFPDCSSIAPNMFLVVPHMLLLIPYIPTFLYHCPLAVIFSALALLVLSSLPLHSVCCHMECR